MLISLFTAQVSCCDLDAKRSMQVHCRKVLIGYVTGQSTHVLKALIAGNTLPDVCQFRLDFVTFESEVNADGSCGTGADTFVAMTPGASQAPTICGMNTGMHSEL